MGYERSLIFLKKAWKYVLFAVVLIIVIAGIIWYFQKPYKVYENRVRVDVYDYDVTDKQIDILSKEEFWSAQDHYTKFAEVESGKKNYGKLIEIVYNFAIEKKKLSGQCEAGYELIVDDEYKKYFFMSYGFPDEPFDSEFKESTTKSVYIISVYGITRDKSVDELKKIIQDSQVKLYITDSVGRKQTETISLKESEIEECTVSKQVIKDGCGTIFEQY